MLTLVYTRIHVALPHDYICVALNKMIHLTLSNNSAVIVARECEIVFCRQLVHCHGSHSDQCLPYELLRLTYKYIALGVISVAAVNRYNNCFAGNEGSLCCIVKLKRWIAQSINYA